MEEVKDSDSSLMVLPAFGKAPVIKLEMKNIRYAESRLIDAKTVSPATYAELEHTFNESYRDLKRHMSTIGYAMSMAKKSLEEAKADVILGSYQEHTKNYPKEANGDVRNAFLARDENYNAALDRVAQLEAMESNFDGKIKVMENVSRYMKKQMDLLLRSGVTGNMYVTSGKK